MRVSRSRNSAASSGAWGGLNRRPSLSSSSSSNGKRVICSAIHGLAAHRVNKRRSAPGFSVSNTRYAERRATASTSGSTRSSTRSGSACSTACASRRGIKASRRSRPNRCMARNCGLARRPANCLRALPGSAKPASSSWRQAASSSWASSQSGNHSPPTITSPSSLSSSSGSAITWRKCQSTRPRQCINCAWKLAQSAKPSMKAMRARSSSSSGSIWV
ncbi:hypothetical protein D3C77_466880 [compost metagenome]